MPPMPGRPPVGALTATVGYYSDDQKDSRRREDYNSTLKAPGASTDA